jgi:ADP-ribose pyrophosphatase YjhB (NUDIX family)
MKEETGLDTAIAELLYVCDRIKENHHVVHLTFLIERVGEKLKKGYEPESGANIIKDVKMVSLSELQNYGFSSIFYELAKSNFPDRGTYKGDVNNIGL